MEVNLIQALIQINGGLPHHDVKKLSKLATERNGMPTYCYDNLKMKDQNLQKQLLTQTTLSMHWRRPSNNTQTQEQAWKKLVITQRSTDMDMGHEHDTDSNTGHKHDTDTDTGHGNF